MAMLAEQLGFFEEQGLAKTWTTEFADNAAKALM